MKLNFNKLTQGNRSLYDADKLIVLNLIAWEQSKDKELGQLQDVYNQNKKWFELAAGKKYSMENLKKYIDECARSEMKKWSIEDLINKGG